MREHGMSEVFERKVAEGLAEFWPRLVNPRSRLWLATTPSQGGQIVGFIAIDGEDLGAGQVHLRWCVLDDGCRGQGVGSALLRKALDKGGSLLPSPDRCVCCRKSTSSWSQSDRVGTLRRLPGDQPQLCHQTGRQEHRGYDVGDHHPSDGRVVPADRYRHRDKAGGAEERDCQRRDA